MVTKWSFPEKSRLQANKKLPDPMAGPDGARITSPEQWPEQREYLKAMLEHYMYGHVPPPPYNTKGEVVGSEKIYDGAAVRDTVKITCGPNNAVAFTATLTRPARPGPFPVVVTHHMEIGDKTVEQFFEEEKIDKKNLKSYGTCVIEEELLQRGYALASYTKTELCPDAVDISASQLFKIYPDSDWRAVAMWSWGHSRIADYLETTDWADLDRLIVTGASRGGKIALHSAVYDERFAVCAASISGCGGAGNFRYLGGRMGNGMGRVETIADMTRKDGMWYFFADRLADFAYRDDPAVPGDEAYLPFDLHFLRALIAPRAVISTDGLDDVWCGCFGTQLSWHASQPTFNFLDAAGKNALFLREDGHMYNETDWHEVLAFCDNVLYGMQIPHGYTTRCYHNTHRIYFTDFFEYE